MELLIRNRPFIITAFFFSLACFGLAAYLDRRSLFSIAAVTAHVFLFLFTTTESFGRVAFSRTKTARILARVFFTMYVLAGAGFFLTWVSALGNA